jgi:hypothetical protein
VICAQKGLKKISAALSSKREQLSQPWQEKMKSLFQRLNKTLVYETLFRIMWYSNLPCSGVNIIKPLDDVILTVILQPFSLFHPSLIYVG